MKYYLPLIIICFITFLRVYFICFDEGYNTCLVTSYSEEKDISIINKIHQKAISLSQEYFPSPHSELLLGMTVGIDNLGKVPIFKKNLIRTGTIHVVVVSGFNITLVFGMVIKILGSRYKIRNLIIAQICTFLYAILSGFDPPVIRSWIMGSVAAWGKYSGRNLDGLRLVIFSGLVMVLINPKFLFSLSFQLSFLATLSLILYSGFFELLISKIIKFKSILIEDLTSTLAAQVLVWPYISGVFGRVSIISPLVNTLILWTVPLATILGGVFLVLGSLWGLLASLFSYIIYPFLDIFVEIVNYLSSSKYSDIEYKISSIFIILYYTIVFLGCFIFKKRHENK